MAGDEEAGNVLSPSRSSRRQCCCTSLQYRAFFIISICLVLIFVAEYWDFASYLVFLGSCGLFIGFFLIILDLSLFFQTNGERRRGRRRFGADHAEEEDNSIWTTRRSRARTRSFDVDPPDYDTTVNQSDRFPLPLYLRQGGPATVTSSSGDAQTSSYTNDGIMSDEDKLPSYEEVMEGSVPMPPSSGGLQGEVMEASVPLPPSSEGLHEEEEEVVMEGVVPITMVTPLSEESQEEACTGGHVFEEIS